MKHLLKRNLTLKALMLLALLSVGVGQAWADEVTDVLDQSVTDVTGTSYTDFSEKKATSDAVYAGQCAGGNSSIQLRSNNNNSGVVTTTSGGKVKSITVVWEDNTANGRTLNIYGKNTAYSAATDLYNSNNQGTLLGTIVNGTSTSLEIEGDYEYIGFRSASGAMYLTSVTIVWEVEGSDPGDTRVATTTSINIPEAFVTDLAGSTNVFAGTLTATVMGIDGAPVSSSVDWTSSDEAVATITSDGAVTLLAVGTTTITATFAGDNTYKGSSKTYMLTVTDSNAKGGKNNPYTVAEAIEATPASGTSANVYIKGIVSAFYNTSITDDGSSFRYYISDDGTTTNQLLVYKGKGLDQVAFSDAGDLLVGDEVVICGGLMTYSNAPEVAAGNYIVSINRPVADVETPVFSPEPGVYEGAQTVTITCATEGATIMYCFDNQDWQEYPANGILLSEYGTYNIHAKAVKGNDESRYAEATYTINDPNAPGSANQPYTVAEARAAIDAGEGITGVYVTGTVSEIVQTYNSRYGNISFNISADGTTTADQLYAYHCYKGADKEKFTSADDIQVGDVVVLYGNLTLYNSDTYELADGNYVVSLQRTEKQDAGIAFTGTTSEYTVTLGETFTAPELSNPNGIENIIYSSSDADVAVVDVATGEVTIKAVGTTTITASSPVTDTYKAGSASYKLTVTAPVQPTITAEKYSATLDAEIPEGDNGITASIKLTVENYDGTLDVNKNIVYCDAEGNILTTSPYTWITIDINTDASTGEQYISGHVFKNNPESEARTAYAKVFVTVDNETFYSPLFAFTQKGVKVSPTGDYFVKVTSSDELTDGDYLIVYEEGSLAFNGGRETLDAASNSIEVTIADDAIAKTDENVSAIFTITAVDEGFAIKSSSSKFIGMVTDANGLKESETAYTNSITFTESGDADIVSGDAHLRYNATSGQERFRYYKSSSYANQKPVALYKLSGEPDTRLNPELSFSETTVNATLGEDFTAPTLITATGFDGIVEYESSDDGIARIMDSETGEIQLVSGGTVTITATFAGNDTYKAGSASYTINITDNRIATTTTQDDIALTLAEIASLTRLAPVVKDADGNEITYQYDEWPTEMSFEIVSDENYLIGSLDNNTGEITLNSATGTITLKAYYNYFNVNTTYKPSECTFTITVTDPSIPVDAATIDGITPTEVIEGETGRLTPSITYAEGAERVCTVTIESLDTDILSIELDNAGLYTFTAMAAGEATVKVTVTPNEGNYQAVEQEFTVTVTAAPDWAYDFDFTTNEQWQFPTTNTVEEDTFNDGTYDITVAGSDGNGYRFIDKYLFLGKQGAYLTLPAFDFAVGKIEVVGRTGASGRVTQNFFVGDEAVSTETTGATSTNIYEIADDYQAAGNVYTLKVTNANNTQITHIYIYKAETSSVLPGDLNGDGMLSTDDVEMLVDYIIGLKPGDFNPVADVNNDGQISIADVTKLISKLGSEE